MNRDLHVAVLMGGWSSEREVSLMSGKGPPLPVGDALHRTMELVSLPDAEDLEEVARAVCEEADVSDHLDEVLAMARNCLASEVVQRAIRSGAWWREVGFVVPEEGSRENGDGGSASSKAGYTTGRVDLVFRDGQGVVVVDYKTNAVGEAATEGHSGQAETYARGVGAATGLGVSDVVLVFARTGAEAGLKAA